MEEIFRHHYKKRSGRKGKGKDCQEERVPPPSDDEPLAQHLEQKRYSLRKQKDKYDTKKSGEFDYGDEGEQGYMSDLGDKDEGGQGSSKGLFGNLESIQKEIGILKNKMLLLSK